MTAFDVAANRCNDSQVLLSLVVPVFNEREAIVSFVEAIDERFTMQEPSNPGSLQLEFIFVDDGSSDGTAEVVRTQCRLDRRVKLISLSRNFGKEAALAAGLKAASGDAVVPMDVDLQDPPEILGTMIEHWRNGAQVVNARRNDRQTDTFFKRSSSSAFYKLIKLISDQPIDEDVGDFRLFDRQAIDALNQMIEHSRFNKGLFSWIGFRTVTIEYARAERAVGVTKWNTPRLMRLAFDGIVSSTTLPLRIWTGVGAVVSLMAFGYAAFLILYTFMTGIDAPGYASIMVTVLFLGGLNLLSLGMLGEYVGRIATQVRGRPLYIISETEGF